MLSALAAILGWASFGIAYQLTDKVRESLEEYNRNGLNNGFTLASIRGNATWILLAGTVSFSQNAQLKKSADILSDIGYRGCTFDCGPPSHGQKIQTFCQHCEKELEWRGARDGTGLTICSA